LNYTFYPYAYDAFWPGAYDDVYYGITGVDGSGMSPAYVGTGGRLQPSSAEVSSSLCAGQTAGVTDWRVNEIAQIVEPDEAQRAMLCSERAWGIANVPIRRMELAVRPDEVQRASLRALQDAIAQAGELLKMDCPTYRPITPVVRIETMERRLDTMLSAINIVQPALQKFYGSLTDEQKERFNRLAPVQG